MTETQRSVGAGDGQPSSSASASLNPGMTQWGRTPTFKQALNAPRKRKLVTRLIQAYVVTMLIVTTQVENRLSQQRQVFVNQLVAKGVVRQGRYDDLMARGRLRLKSEHKVNDELLTDLKARRVIRAYPGDTLSGALAGVFGVSLLLYIYLVPFLWRNPSRILLLRPFGIHEISASLKRVTRKNLAYSGHVFSLEDAFVRHSTAPSIMNLIIRILLPLASIASGGFTLGGPFKVIRADYLVVRSAAEYQASIADINKLYTANAFWRLSFDKIRSIRAADDWWQGCINYLAVWCTVIVVDLTVVKSGTRWELEKIRDDGLLPKSIFIVHENAYENGRQHLAQYWPPNESPHIFRYSSQGRLADETQFLVRVAQIRSASQSV